MYLRFVLPIKNSDTGGDDGVFRVAYDLQREGDLTPDERQELEGLLGWFGDNLAIPTRFNRSKSKGYYRRATKGISWFKSSAKVHVANMYRLAAILARQGYHVSVIKTSRPGYVVHEDDHQIVAEPFSDIRK
jgi:hypothetical protein